MNTPYLLIDANTGINDFIAILYTLRQKNVQVVGITPLSMARWQCWWRWTPTWSKPGKFLPV